MQNQQTKKFLQFNGKNVYFLSANGVWYIAIKPICEALGVDYEAQRKNLQNDKILGGAPSSQTVHDASGRLQKMLCLPEFFIYGWMFKIQSKSEHLEAYQWQCYEILHNHFHGTITERNESLRAKTLAEIEADKLREELMASPKYIELQVLEARIKESKKSLLKLDKELITNQMDLWQSGL